MYQAQVICAAIEVAVNKLLSLDEESLTLLDPINGKQCIIQLHELPLPLVFSFHRTGVALSSKSEKANAQSATKSKLSNDECFIELSIFIINEIKDTSNITRLIREGKLDFDGNLQIAQNMSALFNGLNIDIEEVLSQHVGDIAAHSTMQQLEKFKVFIKRNHNLAMGALSDALLDEKRLAVRPIMVENFIQEVHETREASERLEARVGLLEKKQKAAKGKGD